MAVSMESEKNGRVRSSYTCAYVAAVLTTSKRTCIYVCADYVASENQP